ncbi:MAG: ribosome silencing factor [Bacteroides sp.]|jgi:iojap-like protein
MRQDELDQELLQEIISALEAKCGHEIVSLDMRSANAAMCDYVVICHADSSPHITALVDEVEERVGAATGEYPFRVSERTKAEWVVMDYFSVMVHIFLAEVRTRFNLEGMWLDMPRTYYAEVD